MKKIIIIYILFATSINAQWTKLLNFPNSIDQIQFFNENVGVILSGNSLYRTINGGTSWELKCTLPWGKTYFIDSLYYWILNSDGLFNSTDGGTNWIKKSNLPASYSYSSDNKIFFINKNYGFISTSKEILRTIDSGLSWSAVFSGENLQINKFSFCNEQNGIISVNSYFIRTIDSGKTWTTFLPPDNYNPFVIECLTENRFASVMWDEIQSKYKVLISSDGGNNWESTFAFNKPQNEMIFVNDSIGFVVGDAIYKTTNSGKNWFVQVDPGNGNNSYRNLYMLNENYGWVSNYRDLFKTVNGGGKSFFFFNIDFPNTGDTLFALTEIQIKCDISDYTRYNFKFSSDNGKSWNNIISNVNSENEFLWTIPNIQSNECRLLIESQEYPYISEETGLFTIKPPPPLILTNPNRNDGLIYGGYYYNITWLATGLERVTLEFSSDSGFTWLPIITSYPADSMHYKWKVPLVNSNKCLIRISDSDNPLIYDESNQNFVIWLPFINIKYPDEKTVFHSKKIQQLNFEGNYFGSIKLEFTSDNGKSWEFVDSLNSTYWDIETNTYKFWTKLYNWTVPDIYSDSCRLKLTTYESDEVMCRSALFKIRINITVQSLINNALPGDTIYLDEPEYFECINITKPITIIGSGNTQTKIIGDTIKAVIIIGTNNVTLKNLFITALDQYHLHAEAGNHIPVNGIEINKSNNIIIDNTQISAGKDISPYWIISGGTGLKIDSSSNIQLLNSKLIGADGGENENGGDGLNLNCCDSIRIINCEIIGGQGGNGYSMGATPHKGGYGGNSLRLVSASFVEVRNSHLIGGIGGRTAPSLISFTDQAKAGDGAFCQNSTALFLNSTLEGGAALINSPPYNIPLNTLGGNGLTAVNYSRINFDGGNLIAGQSSSDASGKIFFIDFTSTIKFNNVGPNILPVAYILRQNYPNPFNPTTTIEYSIPERTNVTLKIFDVLGREITTLVNEEKSAGNYKVEFSAGSGGNASSLPSGIYFYRLEAGDFIETEKLVFLK